MSNEIDNFLNKGGVIETLPYIGPSSEKTVGTCKKIPELKTLSEAELLYSKKKIKKTTKKIDLEGIDMSVIPDSLKELLQGDARGTQSKN